MATEQTEPKQVSFHQAVYEDPEMSDELKIYWLKACADQYLEQMVETERAVNILRGGMEVIELQIKEGLHDLIPVSCGVALRATAPHRGQYKATGASTAPETPEITK
jgi:hypothetical protein